MQSKANELNRLARVAQDALDRIKYKVVYIYATPQKDACSDRDVYFLDLTGADVELMTVAGVELTGVELTGADVELMNGAGGNLVGGVESWS